MKRKTKDIIVYFATIVFAVAFIFIGNKLCRTDAYKENIQQMEVHSAKVTAITDVSHSDFNIGDETDEFLVTEKTIFFDAYIKETDETISATQLIDSMMPVNPKDVEEGDQVLVSYDEQSGVPGWIFLEYKRSDITAWLVAAFLLAVILFGRKKGFNTIVSLAFTCLAVFMVFVPSILSGYNIYVMSIITCLFIIFMTLLVINGATKKTLCAGLGCVGGLVITSVLTVIMDKLLSLTGAVSEESIFLLILNEQNPIDLRAIIFGAIVVGAIGATMDIAISMASSIQEISESAGNPTFKQLVKSGLNIGRDILGTMANTLILAYIGSSLTVVLLLTASSGSLLNLFNREMIVVEVMQAMVGSFGILFTIPVTTLLSAYVYHKAAKKHADLQTDTDNHIESPKKLNSSSLKSKLRDIVEEFSVEPISQDDIANAKKDPEE